MNTTVTRKELNAVVIKLKELEMMLGTANPQMMHELALEIEEQSKKLETIAAGLKKQ